TAMTSSSLPKVTAAPGALDVRRTLAKLADNLFALDRRLREYGRRRPVRPTTSPPGGESYLASIGWAGRSRGRGRGRHLAAHRGRGANWVVKPGRLPRDLTMRSHRRSACL